jgi:hypothetical protein
VDLRHRRNHRVHAIQFAPQPPIAPRVPLRLGQLAAQAVKFVGGFNF